MTCREGSRRSGSRGAAAGSAGRASSPARRARTWRGTSDPDDDGAAVPAGRLRVRERPRRTPATWACRTPTRSPTCPGPRAETTQYDRHEVECRCGRVHVADAPPEAAGAPGTVTYGLNVQAWCVFLLVMHHVPVERCADILESMTGTRPSDGWVHALLARAARAVRRGEQDDPGADHPAPAWSAATRPPSGSGPGPKTKQEVPARRLHEPADLLLPRRPVLPTRSTGSCYSDLHGTVIVHDRYQNYVRHEAHCYIAC